MKISTKITAASVALVLLSAMAFLGTIGLLRGRLGTQMDGVIQQQAVDDVGKIVQMIRLNCDSSENQNQTRLTHDLAMAEEILGHHGRISLGAESVEWKAVNQVTKEGKTIQLPKMLLGDVWLGQNAATNQPSPVVDEVSHLTRLSLDHTGDPGSEITGLLGHCRNILIHVMGSCYESYGPGLTPCCTCCLFHLLHAPS